MEKKHCDYCGAMQKQAMFGEGAIKVINELKEKGLIKDFAIGGGVAAIAHVAPINTDDLDVIFEPKANGIDLLQPIFDYLRKKGYDFEKITDEKGNVRKGEHIVIEGTPTQFIVPTNDLLAGAFNDTELKSIGEIKVKILKAEYLIAIYLGLQRSKDKIKLIALLEQAKLNDDLLKQILKDNNLEDKYNKFTKYYLGEPG